MAFVALLTFALLATANNCLVSLEKENTFQICQNERSSKLAANPDLPTFIVCFAGSSRVGKSFVASQFAKYIDRQLLVDPFKSANQFEACTFGIDFDWQANDTANFMLVDTEGLHIGNPDTHLALQSFVSSISNALVFVVRQNLDHNSLKDLYDFALFYDASIFSRVPRLILVVNMATVKFTVKGTQVSVEEYVKDFFKCGKNEGEHVCLMKRAISQVWPSISAISLPLREECAVADFDHQLNLLWEAISNAQSYSNQIEAKKAVEHSVEVVNRLLPTMRRQISCTFAKSQANKHLDAALEKFNSKMPKLGSMDSNDLEKLLAKNRKEAEQVVYEALVENDDECKKIILEGLSEELKRLTKEKIAVNSNLRTVERTETETREVIVRSGQHREERSKKRFPFGKKRWNECRDYKVQRVDSRIISIRRSGERVEGEWQLGKEVETSGGWYHC